MGLDGIKNCGFNPGLILKFSAGGRQYGALSDFQYHAVFPPEFSVLPQKISENLRADFPPDANSRKIRVLCNLLNIKGLNVKTDFPSCNMHCFSM